MLQYTCTMYDRQRPQSSINILGPTLTSDQHASQDGQMRLRTLPQSTFGHTMYTKT